MSFFKTNYESTESAAGNYLKIQPNETVTLRIITAPVEGLQVFDQQKPIRWPAGTDAPSAVSNLDERPRQFAAFGVWHYEAGAAKIWVCSTKSILRDLQDLIEMEGHPYQYDVQVMRKGANLQTRYFTKVVNRTEPQPEVAAAAQHYANEVNLQNLFTGDNPFTPPTKPQQDAQSAEPNTSAPF